MSGIWKPSRVFEDLVKLASCLGMEFVMVPFGFRSSGLQERCLPQLHSQLVTRPFDLSVWWSRILQWVWLCDGPKNNATVP